MQDIPHVKESDVLRWEKVLDSVSPKVREAISSGALQGGRQILLNFRNGLNSAILAYVKGEIPRFLESARDSINRFDLFFSDDLSPKMEGRYIYEGGEECLCISLIIRDPQVYTLASMISPFCRDQIDARAKFISAIDALLSGNRGAAEKDANSLISTALPSHGKGLPSAILAIARRDSIGFVSALLVAVKEFDRHVAADARGTPEAGIFLRGAALVRLYEMVNDEKLDRSSMDVRLVPLVE